MSDPTVPESPEESFDSIFSEYEKSRSRSPEPGKQIEATVVALTPESVLLDIGYKTEGILPLSAFSANEVKPGDNSGLGHRPRSRRLLPAVSRTNRTANRLVFSRAGFR
jgi:hypothetical protein